MSYQPSVPRSIVDTGNSTTNPLAASPGQVMYLQDHGKKW